MAPNTKLAFDNLHFSNYHLTICILQLTFSNLHLEISILQLPFLCSLQPRSAGGHRAFGLSVRAYVRPSVDQVKFLAKIESQDLLLVANWYFK